MIKGVIQIYRRQCSSDRFFLVAQTSVFVNEFKDALKATNVHPTVLTIRLEKAPLSLYRELLKVSADVVPGKNVG